DGNKALQTRQRQLARGPPQKERLDAILRSGRGRSCPTLERIYEAASDLERDLRIPDSANRKIDWLLRIKTCAEKTMAQSQSLDTNSDGEILLIAIQHKCSAPFVSLFPSCFTPTNSLLLFGREFSHKRLIFRADRQCDGAPEGLLLRFPCIFPCSQGSSDPMARRYSTRVITRA